MAARRITHRSLAVALALTAAVGLIAATAFATSGPSSRAMAQEEPLLVTLAIEGSAGLAAFDATLRFDPAVVEVEGIAPGDALPEGSTVLGPTDDGEGAVLFGSFRAGEGPAGTDGTLATVAFRVLGPGEPRIRLDQAASGAYDAAGASIAPPARLVLLGAAPPPIYLPFGDR